MSHVFESSRRPKFASAGAPGLALFETWDCGDPPFKVGEAQAGRKSSQRGRQGILKQKQKSGQRECSATKVSVQKTEERSRTRGTDNFHFHCTLDQKSATPFFPFWHCLPLFLSNSLDFTPAINDNQHIAHQENALPHPQPVCFQDFPCNSFQLKDFNPSPPLSL